MVMSDYPLAKGGILQVFFCITYAASVGILIGLVLGAEHKTIGLMLAGGLLVAGSFAKALNRKGCSGTKAPRKSQLDHAKHGNKRAEKGPQSSIT
jgi:hypothetical protein